MVSRRDKAEIEQSGAEARESEEAVEVRGWPRAFVRNFSNQADAEGRMFW